MVSSGLVESGIPVVCDGLVVCDGRVVSGVLVVCDDLVASV